MTVSRTLRWLSRAAAALALIGAGLISPAPAAADGPQPNAPWPQFKRDPQKTSRTPIVGPTVPLVAWKFDAGSPILSGPIVGVDGTIYFGTQNSRFYAVGPDGKQKWVYQIQGGNGSPTHPLITSKNQVVFGAGGGFVVGLGAADGKEIWKFDLDGAPYSAGREPVRGAPAMATNYPNILIGADNTNVYELEERGAYKSVRRGEAGPVRAGAAISADATIVWASGDPALFGGFAQGGNKWQVGTDGQLSTPAIGPDNVVYAFSEGGSMFAVKSDGVPKFGYDDSQVKDPVKDAEKRKPRWSARIGSRFRSSPALAPDGTLYAGADDGKLYAVDSSNGSTKWSFATGAAITSSPAIGGNGLIYVGSIDSRLYVVSPDGQEVASFQTDGAIDVSSPAIGADGTLYLGNRVGSLYAFKEGRPGAPFTPQATPGATAVGTPTGSGSPGPTATPDAGSRVAFLAPTLPTDRSAPAGEGRYFPETGHNVKGLFLEFFDANAGVDFLGFPRTEEILIDGRRVQYFQRGRMEYQPEQSGTPFVVQLTLIGDQVTAGRRPFPTATPLPEGEGQRYFAEVRHIVHEPFLTFFDGHGGLDRLGYPISEQMDETVDGRSITVQYFQRARLESHPERAGTADEIQLGLIGDQALRLRGWLE